MVWKRSQRVSSEHVMELIRQVIKASSGIERTAIEEGGVVMFGSHQGRVAK